MFRVVIKSLLLVLLGLIVALTWTFDKMLWSVLFEGVFSEQSTHLISLVAATVFVGVRVAIYFTAERKWIVWLTAFGAFLVSFLATMMLMSTGLNAPNSEEAYAEAKNKVNAYYNGLILSQKKERQQELKNISDAFKEQRQQLDEDYAPKLVEIESLIKDEKKKQFKSGPNKGRYDGTLFKRLNKQKDGLLNGLMTLKKPLTEQELSDKKAMRDHYANAIAKLEQEKGKAVMEINIDDVAKTEQAQSKYMLSLQWVLKLVLQLEFNLATIIAFITFLVAILFEAGTICIPHLYKNVKVPFQSSPPVSA